MSKEIEFHPSDFTAHTQKDTTTTPTFFKRYENIDFIKGIVITLMILGHSRAFYGLFPFEPKDLNQTFPLLFFTRWIGNFCAPTFIFLAGIGISFSSKSKHNLSIFLLKRGIWIIFLELTVVNLLFSFYFVQGIFMLQVLWVTGLSMVLLAGLIHLPKKTLLLFSLFVIFGHNLTDNITNSTWILLHKPKMYFPILNLYNIVPWFAVMSLGYVFGDVFKKSATEQKKICLTIGITAILGFIALRYFNIYGNPKEWISSDRGTIYTVLSFIDTNKYPPSLQFLMMTLGPVILSIPFISKSKGALFTFFTTIGKVPMFCYLTHIALINISSVIYHFVRYGFPYMSPHMKATPEKFTDLTLIPTYVAFLLISVAVYLLAKPYMKFKFKYKDKYWVLRYM